MAIHPPIELDGIGIFDDICHGSSGKHDFTVEELPAKSLQRNGFGTSKERALPKENTQDGQIHNISVGFLRGF
jgi:hypothetical protein